MTMDETAKSLGIGINLYKQFDISMMTLWTVAHNLDKLTLIQLMVQKHGFPRESIYHRCGDELDFMREMWVEINFIETMEEFGFCDTKASSEKMWKFIEYWREM